FLRVLFVFAQFSDEVNQNTNWPLNQLPIFANDLIDQNLSLNYRQGTLSDYWRVMSHGNFDFIGDVYPQLVILPSAYSYQQANKNVDDVNQDLLNQIDPYINYSLYDNWKLENGEFVFSPGDAGGYVDMICLLYRNPGDWFNDETAWASLGWNDSWTINTQDFNNKAVNIKIKGEGGFMTAISSGLTIQAVLNHCPNHNF